MAMVLMSFHITQLNTTFALSQWGNQQERKHERDVVFAYYLWPSIFETSVIFVVFPIWYFLLFIAFPFILISFRARTHTQIWKTLCFIGMKEEEKVIGGGGWHTYDERCALFAHTLQFNNIFYVIKFREFYLIYCAFIHSVCRCFFEVSILINITHDIPNEIICNHIHSLAFCRIWADWVVFRILHVQFYLSNTCTTIIHGQSKWQQIKNTHWK